MQLIFSNWRRRIPFLVVMIIAIVALLRMLVRGPDSPYKTDSIDGALIYREACSGCHGQHGKGVRFYFPDLASESLTSGEVQKKIHRGGLVMPAFKNLNEIQSRHVAEYVGNKQFLAP